MESRLTLPKLKFFSLMFFFVLKSLFLVLFKFFSNSFLRSSQSKQIRVLGNTIPVLGVKPKRGWYVFCSFFKMSL